MKLLVLLFLMLTSSATWLGDFNQAQSSAHKSNKLILINFSGSDWCGPCIRLRKEIFDTSGFDTFASENLVLVRADFPRQKKNQLSKEQIKKNESLADKYNPQGKFPFTLLVDAKGKILKTWDGLPEESAQDFIAEITHYTNASR